MSLETELTQEDTTFLDNAFADTYLMKEDEEEETVLTQEDASDLDNMLSGIETVEIEEEETVLTQEDVSDLDAIFKDSDALISPPDRDALQQFDLEQEEKSFDEFAADQNFMDRLRIYSNSRFGEDGAMLPNETNKEYLERFLSHLRYVENNTVGLAGEIDYLRGASKEDRENFGYLYAQIDDRLPTIFEEGGAPTAQGLRDTMFYLIADPINLLGLGVGKLATRGAAQAIKQALISGGREAAQRAAAKRTALEVAGTAAGAGVQTGIENIGYQRLRQAEDDELYQEGDIDLTQAGIAAGLGTVLGGAVGGITSRQTRKLGREGAVADDVLYSTQKEADEAIKTKEIAESLDKNVAFDPIEGQRLMSELSNVDNADMLQPRLKIELQKRVTAVAKNILNEQADLVARGLAPRIDIDLDKKAGEVVAELIQKEGIIDSDVLGTALKQAGLSVTDFAQITQKSLSDDAKGMNAYSPIGKIIKKLKEIDPDAAKRLDIMAGKNGETISTLGRVHDVLRRFDRERRAIGTSAISTTARNLATAGGMLTMGTFADFIESGIYHFGKAVSATVKGEASFKGVQQGLRDILSDTFGTIAALNNVAGSKEMATVLLQNQPRLARQIDRALQDVGGDEGLSKFARLVNGLNIAQDVFFRRAVFNASVEKQLRREGEDVFKIMRQGKNVPLGVMQKAADDAMTFTFSRMPKKTGGKFGDTLGHHFIRMTENLPFVPVIGTGTHPYARFMVNAMQMQFTYSPLNMPNALMQMTMGAIRKTKATDDISNAMSDAMMLKGRQNLSKSIVGSAALGAAIKYRADNQDVDWYMMKNGDGSTTDTRPFFPAAPYLLVADILVKMANGDTDKLSAKEIISGFTGAQLRTGSSSYVVDTMFDLMKKEGPLSDTKAEKIAEIAGKYVGEMGSMYLTPAKLVTDVLAQFDKEQALIRDPRQVTGEGAIERGLDATRRTLLRQMPMAKYNPLRSDDDPVAEIPTRDAPMYRQSPLVKALLGPQFTERKTDVEKEITKNGFETFNIVRSTGDKTADAYIKRFMGKLVENQLANFIDTDYYKGLKSSNKRKAAMNNMLIKLRGIATELGQAEAWKETDKAYTPFDRAKWMRLPSNASSLADAYYLERHGKSVTEMQALEPDVPHYAIGIDIGRALNKAF
tara:strand:- start:91 stop:3558 length:3468 start_codon:yes stop_codon:yes gene_type:complete